MKKITLKLSEIYQLHTELKGLKNNSTGEVIIKGLLDEKLTLSVKYHLSNLSETLLSKLKPVDKLKEESIKKLGEGDDEKGYFISIRINEKFDKNGNLEDYDINPKYIEYQKEIEDLLNQTCEIEYNELTLEDINTTTEVNPQILFKLINNS